MYVYVCIIFLTGALECVFAPLDVMVKNVAWKNDWDLDFIQSNEVVFLKLAREKLVASHANFVHS